MLAAREHSALKSREQQNSLHDRAKVHQRYLQVRFLCDLIHKIVSLVCRFRCDNLWCTNVRVLRALYLPNEPLIRGSQCSPRIRCRQAKLCSQSRTYPCKICEPIVVPHRDIMPSHGRARALTHEGSACRT